MTCVLRYISTAVGFVHPSFKSEVKGKLFNIILDLLKRTKNDGTIQLLRRNLLDFTATENNREALRQLYEGGYQGLTCTFTGPEKWRVIIRLQLSTRYSNEQKAKWINGMKEEDKTDQAKKYGLLLDAMKDCPENLESLFKSYMNPERSLSTSEMQYSLMGFSHPGK